MADLTLVKDKMFDLEQIRTLEYEARPPVCKITWANGDSEIIKEDYALGLMLVLKQRERAREKMNERLGL